MTIDVEELEQAPPDPRHHRSWLPVAIATAAVFAVVAGIAVTVAAAGGDDDRPPAAVNPQQDTEEQEPAAVPWIDAPAPDYEPLPTREPTLTTDAQPCRPDDLQVHYAGRDGAGGVTMHQYVFRNTGTRPCLLKGYPTVSARRAGQPDVVASRGTFIPPGRHTSDLAPGDAAELNIENRRSSDCSDDGMPTGGDPRRDLRLTLPGGGDIPLSGVEYDVSCGFAVSRFWVNVPDNDQRDPLSDLVASLHVPDTGRVGEALIYTVDLRNPTERTISLDRCPGYLEVLASADRRPLVKTGFALNCDPVGSIAAGESVAFEMRMSVPADAMTGPATVTWGLSGPGYPEDRAALVLEGG